MTYMFMFQVSCFSFVYLLLVGKLVFSCSLVLIFVVVINGKSNKKSVCKD